MRTWSAPQGSGGLPARVRTSDVTLGDSARASAKRFDILEQQLCLARACSISTHETPEHVVAIAQLPDGRRVRMRCSPDRPAHIIGFSLA
jgi:hypothetical protein